MNYYEELGISPQATEQEIRKAHRRLVKLMHPDAQPDQGLKMVAETQMRRLNSIVSTLLDSEQRRSYDHQLRSSTEAMQRPASVLTNFGGMPWWMASTVAAIILTLGAVWLWADYMGNTSGRRVNRNLVYVAAGNRPAVGAPASAASDPDGGSAASADDRDGASFAAPAVPPAIPAPVSQQTSSPQTSAEQNQAARGEAANGSSNPAPIQKATLKKEERATPPMIAVNHAPVVTRKPDQPAAVAKPEIKKADPPKPSVIPGAPKGSDSKRSSERKEQVRGKISDIPSPSPRKQFQLPAGSLIASAAPVRGGGESQLPTPPGVSSQNGREYGPTALPAAPLPAAVPPKAAEVMTPASPTLSSAASASKASRDPLEGEWVYAPKEPERRRAGFYPPEYIDLKLFGSGEPGNLKGEYSAKYVVTDRPVSPEVSFQLASAARGSRKFLWQSSTGAKGTLNIDPIDDHTIRIDWHTTSSMREPALTSGQATLVRK